MRVNVHAVLWRDGRLAVVRQRRQGQERLSLPGGRVKRGETVLEALVREVEEEAGLVVIPGPLLYVAEVVARHVVEDLQLVFLVEGPGDGASSNRLEWLEAGDPRLAEVRPPVAEHAIRDAGSGYADAPRWLGNVWDAELGRP